MKTIVQALVLTALCAAAAAIAQSPAPSGASAPNLDLARFTTTGKLLKPADMERWVFLGTSLGMGYNPGSFNAKRPGQFQVVLMEPLAYQHFVKNGSYAPGSMFLLAFYDTETQPRSINQNGFTQAELTNFEIHLLRPGGGRQEHDFYVFGARATEGDPLPPGNRCVTCHIDHGAFDGTFAQFYPTIRPLIPKEALERALKNHDIR